MSEKTARCLGWLQGFSSTVWALVSTNDGAKLVDSSTADEYDKVVKELADELGKTITEVKVTPNPNYPYIGYPVTLTTVTTDKITATWKGVAE